MKWINLAALALIIIGALNWGLWAVAEFDLVAEIFGGQTAAASRVVYGLVGLAGVYSLTMIVRLLQSDERAATPGHAATDHA
jgi:uncharacterized protein